MLYVNNKKKIMLKSVSSDILADTILFDCYCSEILHSSVKYFGKLKQ